MKTMYIPKGTVMRYESINTDTLIVKGQLIVKGIIQAKRISGSGVIEAHKIIAHTIIADVIDVEHIFAKKVVANKVFCISSKVSFGVLAKDYIEAYNVETPKITITLSKIERIEANEIIRLVPKKRNFLGVLFVSWLQERFMTWLFERSISKKAEYHTNTDRESKAEFGKVMKASADFDKMIESYKAKCSEGYRLVLEPADKKSKPEAA